MRSRWLGTSNTSPVKVKRRVQGRDGSHGDPQLQLREDGLDAVVRAVGPGEGLVDTGSAGYQLVGSVEGLGVPTAHR